MKTKVKENGLKNTPKAGVVKKSPLKVKQTEKKAAAKKTLAQQRDVETPAKVLNKSVNKNTPKKKPAAKSPAAKGKGKPKKPVVTEVDEDEEEVENDNEQEENVVEEEQDDEIDQEENVVEEQQDDEMDQEEEEEAGDDEEEEEEEAVTNEGENDDSHEEAEEENVEDDGEEDEGDEEEEEEEEVAGDEEESENEAPVEAPVKKDVSVEKKPVAENKQHFSTDPPPADMPEENKVYIKNAEKVKVLTLFHVLKNCGIILNIHKNTTETGTDITIAYETKDSAMTALMFLQKFTLKPVGELTLFSKSITEKNLNELSEKTVVVRNVNPSLSIEDIKKAFSDCGTILYASFIYPQYPGYSVKYVPVKGLGFGKSVAIAYKTKDGAECALEKHNSVLGERHIWVSLKNKNPNEFPECTIKLANTKKYTTFSPETLKSIFEDCGEIHYIEILCSETLLATITFTNKESVEKALAMNNTTVEELPITIITLNQQMQGTAVGAEKTTIYVYGYKPGTSEEDLRGLFEREVGAEGIKSMKIYPKSGYITFNSVDTYCKSFKLDESRLNGQLIFIEPDSTDKSQRTLRRQQAQPKFMENRKRPFNTFVDHKNSPVQKVTYGPSANKRPRPNFPPRDGPQGFVPRNNNNNNRNQNGFQPRNNFQGNQNGFAPRNNFQGNNNRFPPRNQQAGNGNGNFFPKQFNKSAENGQQNFMKRNSDGPKKFNKNKSPGGAPKMFKKNNIIPGSA